MDDAAITLDQDELTLVGSAARRFLETVWPDWQRAAQSEWGDPLPIIMSSSTCGRSIWR